MGPAVVVTFRKKARASCPSSISVMECVHVLCRKLKDRQKTELETYRDRERDRENERNQMERKGAHAVTRKSCRVMSSLALKLAASLWASVG